MNKKETPINWDPFSDSSNENVEERTQYINKTILREKKKPTRFFVDNEYVDNGYLATFPPTVTLVYMALLKHCNTSSQTAYPGLKRLQKLTGIRNRNSIITCIQMLEDFNILTIVRSKGGMNNPNMYGFVSSDEWHQINPDFTSRKLTIKQYQKMYQ